MKRKQVLALLLAAMLTSGSVITAFASEMPADNYDATMTEMTTEETSPIEELGDLNKNAVEDAVEPASELSIDKLWLDKTNINLKVHEKTSLLVSFLPENPTITGAKWTSSNEDVVLVGGGLNPEVIARGVGTATITARILDKTATCTVTVEEMDYTSIHMDKEELRLKVGETDKLKVHVFPEGTTLENPLVWTSSNNDVATVDDQGNVKAIGTGTTIIKATSGDYETECAVMVFEDVTLNSIEFDKKELTLVTKSQEQLTIKYNPSNAAVTEKPYWDTTNWASVSVDQWGAIRTHSPGTAIITATIGDKVATCKVTVVEQTIPLEGISLDKYKVNLTEGESEKITVLYKPANATVDRDVTWEVENESVASIDKDGNITAIKAGTTDIKAIVCGQYTSTCTVTVTEKPDIPLTPLEPSTPVEPEKPEEPDIPLTPLEPSTPVEPEKPEEPDIPLAPLEPSTPAEPEKPEEPDIPPTPLEPSTPVEPEEKPEVKPDEKPATKPETKPEVKPDSNKSETVQTGDPAQIALFGSMLAMSGAALVKLSKKDEE